MAFRDLLMLLLTGITASLAILLPHIADQSKASDDAQQAPMHTGSVVFEAIWPPDVDADVDLWVRGPDGVPVGYSNKGGPLFNLLRDDLGKVLDASGINLETSYSRGVGPGHYVANVHLYRNRSASATVPVQVIASVKPTVQAPLRQLLATEVKLTIEGQERTAFGFDLDEQGNLVPDSVTTLRVPLRDLKGK